MPVDCLSLVKLKNNPSITTSPTEISATVESGFYRLPAGTPENNENWRRLQQVNVEPNFTIKIDHGGNKYECVFIYDYIRDHM